MAGRRSRLAAPLFLSILLTLLPSLALAQDDDGMSFGADEAAGGEDEGFTFGEEAAAGGEEQSSDPLSRSKQGGTVGVVGVKTADIDDSQRQKLQDELNEAMGLVSGYEVRGEGGILSGLDERGEQCVRESICLSSVGRDAGVDKLLLARVIKVGETYQLSVDFFDVNDRLFITTANYEDLGSPSAAIDKVEDAVRAIFKVRQGDDGPVIEEKPKNEWIQPTFAYTSAGLAAICLGGGIYFGLQAKSDYDAVKTTASAGMTSQRELRNQFDAANNKARRANLFYGLGVGMGILSAVLFTVDFGSDVADDDDEYVRIKDLRVAPAVSAQGAGLGAAFRF